MTTSLSHVHVLVDDPDAALVFYRDLLGLTVQSEVANDGFRWIVLATADQPEIQVVLSQPAAGRSQDDGATLSTLLAKGELGAVQFRTDDLDALFDTLAGAAGVEVVQEPAEQFWGARDAAVRDPAGNLVRIEQA